MWRINRTLLSSSRSNLTKRTFDHLYLFLSVIFCLIQMATAESVCLFYFFHIIFNLSICAKRTAKMSLSKIWSRKGVTLCLKGKKKTYSKLRTNSVLMPTLAIINTYIFTCNVLTWEQPRNIKTNWEMVLWKIYWLQIDYVSRFILSNRRLQLAVFSQWFRDNEVILVFSCYQSIFVSTTTLNSFFPL